MKTKHLMTINKSLIGWVQESLSRIYTVSSRYDISSFILDEMNYNHLMKHKDKNREGAFLILQEEGNLFLGFYLASKNVFSLNARNPIKMLSVGNFSFWRILVEEISHIFYTLYHAPMRQITQLELELQSEIDVTLLTLELLRQQGRLHSACPKFFYKTDLSLQPELTREDKERYEVAHCIASPIQDRIFRHWAENRQQRLLPWLRNFFRMGQSNKIERSLEINSI